MTWALLLYACLSRALYVDLRRVGDGLPEDPPTMWVGRRAAPVPGFVLFLALAWPVVIVLNLLGVGLAERVGRGGLGAPRGGRARSGFMATTRAR